MTVAAMPMEKSFLGEEFLSWLWWRCQTGKDVFDVDGGTVSVLFDDYLTLAREVGDVREVQTMRKGNPSYQAEAMTGFLQGKQVAAAKLVVARGALEWELTLEGRTLAFSSVKAPKTEERHPDDILVERLEGLDDLTEAVDGLYLAFMEERLAPKWHEEVVPQMRENFEDLQARAASRG